MLYIDEEPKESDMVTQTQYSPVGQVSHPCEGNWEIYEIGHERIPYSKELSIFERKEDLGERRSGRRMIS